MSYVAYLEKRPVLVCVDEDVQIETRFNQGDDMDVQVQLTARTLCVRDAKVLLDVYVPARVWRAWARSVEQQIKAEYASRSRSVNEDEDDEEK